MLHDIAALVMLVGFIVHIYEDMAARQAPFRSMTRGSVHKHHHPAWYRNAAGRDPRADYEAAAQRRTEPPRGEGAPLPPS